MVLGVPLERLEILDKYLSGLHEELHAEVSMVLLKSIGEACKRAMGYEELNRLWVKALTKKATKGSLEGSKGAVQEADQEEKKSSKHYHHCKKPGHMKSECWKLHSELTPKRRNGPKARPYSPRRRTRREPGLCWRRWTRL